MRKIRLLGVATLIVAVIGCSTTQTVVQRSALVPAITPPMMDGQPIDNGVAQLGFGNSTYLRASQPVQLSSSTMEPAGLYIPRTQFGLQALFRLGPTALGPKLEIGLDKGAQPIASHMMPRPSGPVVGFGPAFQASIPVSGGFRIGLGLETLVTFCPYFERETDRSTGQIIEEGEGSNPVLVLGLSVIPSYRIGPVTIFAGVSGRNQPATDAEEFRTIHDGQLFEEDDEVTFGTMYGIAFLGTNLRLFKRLDLTAQIYYPWTDEPVQYGGPALAVWLRVTLGSPPRKRRPRNYYAPPPGRYYQAPAPAPAPGPAPAPAPPPGQAPGPIDIQ